jgi:hypothetical protein
MLARFIGGPHDGLEIDRDTINRCCTIQSFSTPIRILTFVLMPPTRAEWKEVVGGLIHKDDLEALVPYFQVRTESGIEFHFDKGGRRFSEVIDNPLPEEDESESEGNYYKCLRGDSENLALTEPYSFVVQDAKGRNWICYPVSREDVEKLSLLDQVGDVKEADAKLRKHGLAGEGTEVRVYFCRDEEDLRERLAEDPPPKPR